MARRNVKTKAPAAPAVDAPEEAPAPRKNAPRAGVLVQIPTELYGEIERRADELLGDPVIASALGRRKMQAAVLVVLKRGLNAD